MWLWIRRLPQETGAYRAQRPAAWNLWIQMPWEDQELITMLLYPDLPWAARCLPCHFGPIVSQVRDRRCSSSRSRSRRCFRCVSSSFTGKKAGCFRPTFAIDLFEHLSHPPFFFFCSPRAWWDSHGDGGQSLWPSSTIKPTWFLARWHVVHGTRPSWDPK